MNQVKRFIKWCIDNDIAFTHIDEAVEAFKDREEVVRMVPPSTIVKPYWNSDDITIIDGTTSCDETFKFTVLLCSGRYIKEEEFSKTIGRPK